MDYYELRKEAAKIIPRSQPLFHATSEKRGIEEKGRKKGYSEFKLPEGEWVASNRLLKADEFGSFVEVSCRAAACPMPLNLDTYDGLCCPFGCKYCVDGDTLIELWGGLHRAIRDVFVGEEILTINETTGKIEYDRVVAKMQRRSNVYDLTVGRNTVRITGNHEVLTREGWKCTAALSQLDEVKSYEVGSVSGDNVRWVRVDSCVPADVEIEVWNIETKKNHNYFANGVCVHNCFADSFRGSLYTSFFDNARTVGLRHSDLDFCKRELEKLLHYRGKPSTEIDDVAGVTRGKRRIARVLSSGKTFGSSGGAVGWQSVLGSEIVALRRAIARELPMRLGIRFEDFVPKERKLGISLGVLDYLADQAYPVMINTKSDLIGEAAYAEVLGRNLGKAAVHMTLISSNNKLLKALEPGAPSYERRIWAMRQLVDAGVRVVARIEPFLIFLSDPPDEVERYMEDLLAIGVRNITFDTYSYTAKNPGIRQSFYDMGLDWDRLFLLGCDSQGLGSLLLGEFIKLWRQRGFSCSTFDMGNAPDNDQLVCYEVGDWFSGGFNYGCSVGAARYIQSRQGEAVGWYDFVAWVEKHDGFLCDALQDEVHHLWNLEGNDAYSHSWARGLDPVGYDAGGILWKWQDTDFRRDLL